MANYFIMRRLKLTIAYDGRPWRGWQSQVGGVTVQDRLETVLGTLAGKRIVVLGSGRTDAGVHAHGQVAHITVDDASLTADRWMRAMNAKLPPSIRILHCEEAPMDFHARFDAISKVYAYRIWLPEVLSPFEDGLSWHPWGGVNRDLVRESAAILQGRHNFARLSAKRSDEPEDEWRENPARFVRDVSRVSVLEEQNVLRLEFEGEGFLYHMVRLMVGSIVRVARGRDTMEWLRDLVANPNGERSNFCAPAAGLYLMQVKYPDQMDR